MMRTRATTDDRYDQRAFLEMFVVVIVHTGMDGNGTRPCERNVVAVGVPS